MVFVQHLAVVKQSANQRALAVVDAATGMKRNSCLLHAVSDRLRYQLRLSQIDATWRFMIKRDNVYGNWNEREPWR